MLGMSPTQRRLHLFALCSILACYASARILQVVTGPVPRLSLVAMEVLCALVFALVDGSRTLGLRGILSFAAVCILIGNVIENVGVAVGIPFGRYTFTSVMGPKLFHVPILLGLAYIGMAYVSWMVACAILKRHGQAHPMAIPFLAALVMTSWDLAQDPVWSTMLGAWVWRDGGRWFGVPISNYVGWYLTVLVIYLAFAATAKPQQSTPDETASAWPSIVFYLLCAGGNVLQLAVHRNVEFAMDGSGSAWRISHILTASAVVSVFVMGSFAIAAAGKNFRQRQRATD